MTDTTAPQYRPGRELLKNCAAGLRLASGRPLAPDAFTCTLGQALAVLGLLWAVVVARDWLSAGLGSNFWVWGYIAESARNHLWLASLAVVAWLAARPRSLVTLITALGWANLPMGLVAGGLQYLAARYVPELEPRFVTLFQWSWLLWQCAVLWRALALLAPLHPLRAVAGIAVHAAALYAAVNLLPESPMFYLATEAPPALDIETVYYRQPALLDAALASLAPQDPARIDLYFIGVGAFAEQDVFMREVQSAQRIVDRRLGVRGRSLALINNAHTVDSIPLANRHNLERAINGVAGQMDRGEDILVLFVSSHGSEDASIAVEFEGLGMADIYAADIRAMLDNAGVKWRVVIVSACYSGTFIPPLQSPTTLVMTAAAADKSSFGCSSENAWTYFGRAYFAEALARTGDLIHAFRLAETRIAAREATEHKEPSQPQMRVGERIAEHLRAWRPTTVDAQVNDSR